MKDSSRNNCIDNRILKEDGMLTENYNDARREILMYNFTMSDEEDYHFIHHTYEDNMHNDGISMLEIDRAIYEMDLKKAVGIDGESGDIIKLLYNANKNVFVDLFNKLWNLHSYPNSWKIAIVAHIPKDGKDLRLRDSYRPICLLPVWGKVFDKLLNNRLMFFLEKSRLLDNRQFGFRKNRSTLDALSYVKNYIDVEVEKKNLVCMIPLDIKNAFNSIHKNDILEIMDLYNFPYNLKRMIDEYLRNRKVQVTNDEYLDFNVGVPQGSSLGPSLWLIIINELLKKNISPDFEMICYADDIVILLSATASYHFSEKAKVPLLNVLNWCNKFRLKLSV